MVPSDGFSIPQFVFRISCSRGYARIVVNLSPAYLNSDSTFHEYITPDVLVVDPATSRVTSLLIYQTPHKYFEFIGPSRSTCTKLPLISNARGDHPKLSPGGIVGVGGSVPSVRIAKNRCTYQRILRPAHALRRRCQADASRRFCDTVPHWRRCYQPRCFSRSIRRSSHPDEQYSACRIRSRFVDLSDQLPHSNWTSSQQSADIGSGRRADYAAWCLPYYCA